MGTQETSRLSIEILANDSTEEDIDRMTRELLSELRDMDVESAQLAPGGHAPDGTKAIDPITTGSIIISVLPALLPKIVDGVQAWAMRGSNRTVKFKGRIAGQPVEFEGSSEDLQKLLAALQSRRRVK